MYPNVITPRACKRLTTEDVVASTHVTLSRLPALKQLVKRWADGDQRACLSVSLSVCSRGDWRAFLATYQKDALMRRHVTVSVVLGQAEPVDYPYNIQRNAALEPWNSAFAKELQQLRSPSNVAAGKAAHAAALAEVRGTLLQKAKTIGSGSAHHLSVPPPLSPPQPFYSERHRRVVGDQRPWLLVIDVDDVPSASAAVIRQLMRRASDAVSSGDASSDLRRIFTLTKMEPFSADPRTKRREAIESTVTRYLALPAHSDASARAAFSWMAQRYNASLLQVAGQDHFPVSNSDHIEAPSSWVLPLCHLYAQALVN